MKILVYGAGVLGCNLARNLFRAGKDVTLFARGNWAAALPEKNVLFAFALSAGHRESDLVVSIDLKKITIGQLPGAASNKQLIGQIFCGTKYKVAYEPMLHHRFISELAQPSPYGIITTKNHWRGLPARPRNQDISSVKKKCPFFHPKSDAGRRNEMPEKSADEDGQS